MNKNIINTEVIERYLQENNLSMTKFCQICKISTSTYKRVMANKDFNMIALFRIARVIDIPIHNIFNA